MITITCSNPICGKSFLYDEEKFPGAKKVQCPYCKTIQGLAVEEPAVEETPFFEEPSEPEPAPEPPPSEPAPVKSAAAPAGKKEDFFTGVSKTPQAESPPPAQVTDEPKRSKKWLLIIPFLIVFTGVLLYFLWPSPPSPSTSPISDSLKNSKALLSPTKIFETIM